jgi:hypothetical protein
VRGPAAGWGVVSVEAVQVAGEHVYWSEGRATGDVLVRSRGSGGVENVLPPGVAVASYVHEYGGGAYLATSDALWFVRADDQQLWRTTRAGLRAVTAAPQHGEDRYADLRLSAPGLLVAVRERHHHEAVTNELVMVPADGSAAPWPVARLGFLFFPATESGRESAGLDDMAAPADALGRHMAMGSRDPDGWDARCSSAYRRWPRGIGVPAGMESGRCPALRV